ncbi:MAG: hypothetical protein AAGG48_10600 [Planctomycetota bacterium]
MSSIVSQILSLPTPFDMAVMVVLILASAGVLITAVTEIRKYFTHRELMELKRELAGHGMSAEEIERIVTAKHDAVV